MHGVIAKVWPKAWPRRPAPKARAEGLRPAPKARAEGAPKKRCVEHTPS